MKKSAILYIALGQSKYRHECVYSLLSLRDKLYSSLLENTPIFIFTDNTIFFKQIFENDALDLHYVQVNKELMSNWTLNGKYMFRVKICALKYAFDHHLAERILLIDTDTAIVSDISIILHQIGPKKFVLHAPCSPIKTAVNSIRDTKVGNIQIENFTRLALYFHIVQNENILNNDYPIDPNFTPYNSGIIGMSLNDSDLLSDILKLSDQIYEKWRYLCSEEFAFSYYFQKKGSISNFEELIYHYPDAKFARYILGYMYQCFFGEDYNEYTIFVKEHRVRMEKSNLTIEQLPGFIRFLFINRFGQKISYSPGEYYFYLDKNRQEYSREYLIQNYKKYHHLIVD